MLLEVQQEKNIRVWKWDESYNLKFVEEDILKLGKDASEMKNSHTVSFAVMFGVKCDTVAIFFVSLRIMIN